MAGNQIPSLDVARQLVEPEEVTCMRQAMIRGLRPISDLRVEFDIPFIPRASHHSLFARILNDAGYTEWEKEVNEKLNICTYRLHVYL